MYSYTIGVMSDIVNNQFTIALKNYPFITKMCCPLDSLEKSPAFCLCRSWNTMRESCFCFDEISCNISKTNASSKLVLIIKDCRMQIAFYVSILYLRENFFQKLI